jgi:hypothetical protein
VIPKTVFDGTCDIPFSLRLILDESEELRGKYYDMIKGDVKKFFRSFYKAGSFNGERLEMIASHYVTKLDRKTLVEESLHAGLLTREPFREKGLKKGEMNYGVPSSRYQSVSALLNQNNLDTYMEAFCDGLLTKYYKISASSTNSHDKA